MKFFLDTANLEEIRQAADLGLLDGVTTNPSLVAKEGEVDFFEHLLQICQIAQGPVSAEVVATDYDNMLREAHELAKLHPNIVVKIPMTPDGVRAMRTLSLAGIPTNCTLVFSPAQALVAAKAGAAYVSPFVGRLDDVGSSGMELVRQIVTIYRHYGFNTQVLVASVRHPMHVVEAALMGADVCTMPFKVLEQLLRHPLTDVGLERFLADWRRRKTPLASA
ncbi:MAG: fructose-6-phosphate aldolase [Bacteroidetes bacterium]|nr:fructose-6-phosphate aldolase [Rhodothermia bacterium]MCS7154324.1 fructose-6-phosphate aldolase [Bacteroidota bacterium]MCX7906639.1 fructose-6-phosphate aldolase [Bacteroidota bacterium]MDW8137080.1 fructose-6-phosphate aldolase [Bacteroidota bacterium]MDW8285049.1 fructose-6-phosphate aldolase [Bacteroidota bacterium]